MPLPPSPFDQNFLGLAGPTATGRHSDLDVAVRTDLCHHPGQRVSVPEPLRSNSCASPARSSLCPAAVCRPGGDDAQAATYPRPEPGLLHRRGTPTKSAGPATQRGGTIADCRERRAAALLGARQVMDERLGLFPGGQQTAARTSFKMGAAASRSDSTGGAHRDGDSQLRAGR